jgi:hypothetical protein
MSALLVPAAEELVAQVRVIKRRSTWTYGTPDGFNRIRSVMFDRKTSGWLRPVLDVIDDPRILSLTDDDGRCVVTWVPDSRADTRTSYPLAEVGRVLAGG